MRWSSLLIGLMGCDVVQSLLPEPECDDLVVVDALSGAAQLTLDPSRCYRDDLVANKVEYDVLDDAAWEPLVAADADPCNTGSTEVLVAELAPGELTIDPVWPEPVEADVWIRVSYRDHRASRGDWSTYFRLGHPRDVVAGADCATE